MAMIFIQLGILAFIGTIVFLVLTIMKKRRAWIGLVSSIGVGSISFVGLLIALAIMGAETTETTTTSESDSAEESDEEAKAEEDTGEESDEEEEEEADDSEELVEDITEISLDLGELYEVNELNIELSSIEITEDDVLVDMTLSNESENTKTFYPDQHDIIIGSKQYGANMFMTKGDVSGEIHSGVEKSGTIRFTAKDNKIDVANIEEIELKLGGVFDEETFDRVQFEEVITID